jgi:capsular polysaccharide biosynthesis protein
MIDHSALGSDGLHVLRPRDYSFVGFEDFLRHIKRHLRRVHIRGGEPTVATLDDAVYVPEELSGKDQVRRGEIAQTVSAASPVAYEREVDEEVVYLGWLFSHYGHFLMQSLARTWVLPQLDPALRVIFHHPSRAAWQPPEWALRMLEAFGVPPERILTLEVPTRVRRLIVPEPLFEPRSTTEDHAVRAHEVMARPYHAVAERIAGDITPSSQPLYLSRRLLPPSQRTMVGEDVLEEMLRANGFRIAHTESMSFEEQVRLVNAHTDIVSNAGSAAHNVLFALHGPRLHLLTNGHQFSPDYYLYVTISGAATTFINCLSTGNRPDFPRSYKLTPHLLDVPTLMAYLDQCGFLTTPMPMWPVEDDAARQARYDEVWLYGYLRSLRAREAPPPEIEQEALRLAPSSWPISLALARYYATYDRARADGLARQFADLAAMEADTDRLGRYRTEVAEMAPILVNRCRPETAATLMTVVAERFDVALTRKEPVP